MKVKLKCPNCGNQFFVEQANDIMKRLIEIEIIGYECIKCHTKVVINKENVSYLEDLELQQEEHLY